MAQASLIHVFDELLALGESANDPVARRNAVINAQQLMLDNAVALFLGYPKTNIVGNKKIVVLR